MAIARSASAVADGCFSFVRYPTAVGSYDAHASHIATERWNRLRAWIGGRGRSMRKAARASSSHCRATDLSRKLGVAVGDITTLGVGLGLLVAVAADADGVAVGAGVVAVGV